MIATETTLELQPVRPADMAVAPLAPAPSVPSPAYILQAVVDKGITSENVAVVKELAAMCREARAEEAKTAFYKAFAALRRAMPVIYADKEVHTKSGALAFTYCSPTEIKAIVEPLMQKFGFCTMSGQVLETGIVTISTTLMHEQGHSETRAFSVRVNPGNQLTTPSQCDSAASTTAERQLLIKLFGLQTRVREEDDPRNLGGPITAEQAMELESRLKLVNGNLEAFLKLAGAAHFEAIPASKYALLDELLAKKEARKH
ncbi:MAG: ERF family protein [Candidatus Hydrogenedentales bacterium]|jgi:hypothetical protein